MYTFLLQGVPNTLQRRVISISVSLMKKCRYDCLTYLLEIPQQISDETTYQLFRTLGLDLNVPPLNMEGEDDLL